MTINWFVNISEILSLVPTKVGIGLRRFWYERTLKKCGKHLTIDHLGAFRCQDVETGDVVSFGRNFWGGHCRIGNNVVGGNNITILSGKNQHGDKVCNTPFYEQKGDVKIINIGSNVWIGTGATICADISDNTIVGAGAFVNEKFPPNRVIAGVPARVIKVIG